MDAKLGATLKATRCAPETYKAAVKLKQHRSYHAAIALVLQHKATKGEACGPLLEACFAKLTDHYAALCVAPTSSVADVRKSYRRLCLRYHPDKSNGTTTTLFQVLVRAWEVLSDETKRRKYDGVRKPTGMMPRPPAFKRTKKKRPSSAKPLTLLRRPTGLRTTQRSPHSLTVVWAPTSGAAGYEVCFRKAGQAWPEAGARVTCAAARKKNLVPRTAYEARVRATSVAGHAASTFSATCAAATTAAPPAKPSAAARRAVAARAAAAARRAAKPPPAVDAWTCRVCTRANGEDAARCRVCAAPRKYECERLFGSVAYDKLRAEKRAAQVRPPPAPVPPAPAAPPAPRRPPPAPRRPPPPPVPCAAPRSTPRAQRRPAPPPVPGAAPRGTPRRSPLKTPRSPYAQPARPAAARRRAPQRAGVGRFVRPAARPVAPPVAPPAPPDPSATQKFLAAHQTPGWYEVAAAGADTRTYYAPSTGASSEAPPANAPQWYRMTDGAHPYFWHAPTGATTWNEPGGSVWRECAAPELGGRKVYVWDGVGVQGD